MFQECHSAAKMCAAFPFVAILFCLLHQKANAFAPSNPVPLHNWGSNFNYSTLNVQYPRTVAEVQQIVRNACKLRVLGHRHSFSKIADSDDTIVSLMGLNAIIGINASVPSVTVQAGILYTDLAPTLQANGYALENLAALAEISVGGAIQTGTHGSGITLQIWRPRCARCRWCWPTGVWPTTGRATNPLLKAVALGLGSLGVVTQVELKLVPTYNITGYVYNSMPMAQALANFDAIQALGYSVNLVYYSGNTAFDQVRINVRSDANSSLASRKTLFGATQAAASVGVTSVDVGIERFWYYNLMAFPFGLSGNDGNQSQTEYFVPYANAVPAIKAVNSLYSSFASVLSAVVVRTARGDDLWMSGFYGNGTFAAIQFSWANDEPSIVKVLPKIESALAPYAARPHLAKLNTMKGSQFLKYFPKLAEFKKLAQQLDPTQKFRNDYINEKVFQSSY